MKRQAWFFAVLWFVCLLPVPGATAATNSELVPGSRIVFPYFDLRPGLATFLLFTNAGQAPTTVRLEFYDGTCLRQDASLHLSGGDVDLLDLAAVLPEDPSGTFRQGFVDAVAGGDVLMGSALIVNVIEDWSVLYHGAAARKRTGGLTPFEPYPTRVFVPAFLTPGTLGGAGIADGLLVLAAPHPTLPGGDLGERPLRTAIQVFLPEGGVIPLAPSAAAKDAASVSDAASSRLAIIPIGQLASSPAPRVGWISVTNDAVDDAGVPFGLVGLYIQTVSRPESSIGMAIRLWADPATGTGP